MSEMSKKARADAKDKVRRLTTTDPHQRVDASSWTPPEPLNADIKTGMRPVSKQARKRGGKVEGVEAKHHAGRKPRKAGGRALVDDFVNRDQKEANESRAGIKHDGGMKNGGHVHSKDCKYGKCMGGSAYRAGGSVSDGELQGTRPTGGRLAKATGGKVPDGGWGRGEARDGRKEGGRTGKGKMSVNIVIAPQGGGGQGAPHPMMGGQPPVVPPKMPMPPQGMPPGAQAGAPPPMMPPGAGGPPGMPPGAMPPPGMMGRKAGGLVDGGAGGGLGRLEKVKDYGRKARELDGHY